MTDDSTTGPTIRTEEVEHVETPPRARVEDADINTVHGVSC